MTKRDGAPSRGLPSDWWGLRSFKVFVLFGLPFLGALYAYQFTGQSREKIVPFRPFLAPASDLARGSEHGLPSQLLFREPITVVNFWATWCPPCVEEFPAMMELQRQLEGRGLEIIFVSVDEDWTKVPAFLQDYQIEVAQGRMLWDPDRSAATEWGSSKFPETFVVRRDNWVLEKIVGAQQWTRPAVVSYFQELVGKHSGVTGTVGLLDRFVSSAWAQPTEAMIHEEDRKNLDRLRANIETALGNLQKADGAYKEEQRNLAEQEIVLERRRSAERRIEEDLALLRKKQDELKLELQKSVGDRKAEESEKARVEAQVAAVKKNISRIESELEKAKAELVQVNKALGSRVQAIETFEKAQDSGKEQISAINARVSEAESQLKGKQSESRSAERELSQRKQRLEKISAELDRAKAELERQKLKLSEFEALLRK